MDIENVPQDESLTHKESKKVVYATDVDGKVKVVGSSGWNVEETATVQALEDLEERAKEAYALVVQGVRSPLYFHMYDARMDIRLLSQSTGFFKFTIKRDLKPAVFKTLDQKRLSVYADVMRKTVEELRTLPENKYA